MTVLVFDSGIGGLTVMREARVLMPDHRFVYLADDAAFPYGDWEEQALIERMLNVFDEHVRQHNPVMIIVACNTASTIILPYLREKYDFPIVGTVPAIKPAAERTASNQVSVLATPGTVQRDYTRDLISEFAAQVNVRLVGAEKLADIAEQFMMSGTVDEDIVRAEIADCFVDVHGARTDIVVLACTHYPFLTNVFRRLAPWPVDWLNPAEAIARHAKSVLPRETNLEDLKALGQSVQLDDLQDLAFFTSGPPNGARKRLLSGFGLQVA